MHKDHANDIGKSSQIMLNHYTIKKVCTNLEYMC